MAHPHYSSAEIAQRGQAFYEREIRGSLVASDHGKYLVLDIETGEYEIDTDELVAVKRARAKCPNGAFYVLRVGHPAAMALLGGCRVVLDVEEGGVVSIESLAKIREMN
jgi:hypothetical protein